MLIKQAFTFRQMPSGRHAFALALVATAARDAGLPNTAARADRAVAQAHVALELEQMWLSVRANKSRARGNSKEIDKQLDEQVSALEQRLKAEARGDATDPAVKMARELLEQLFPEGLRGVTHKAYEVQQGLVDIILKRLDGEFQPHVHALNLDRQIERIRPLNEELRVEMAFEKARRVKYKDVLAAQNLLHTYACKTIAALYFELDGDDDATLALHAKIMAPFTHQQNRVLQDRKRKRKTVDIDPKSGEDLPDQDETTKTTETPS